ncbi:hypothetical protein BD413DRAFT_695122 [Trametes elegans]|nr:hypothetical protein BD413DRAFT_695122 [Trametes elegans]
MFIHTMQPGLADGQDYYPPLDAPPSRSSSPLQPPPQTHSPSLARTHSHTHTHSFSPSPAPSSLLGVRRSTHGYPYRAPPAPPTSIPLDDSFDAPTTAAPSEWARAGGDDDDDRDGGGRGGHGDGHPEYDESVTGYQNYVVEMERMLEGQMESAARAQERMRDAHNQHQQHLQNQHQQHQRIRRTSTASPVALRHVDTTLNESARGSSRAPGGGSGGRRSLGPHLGPPVPPPENAREVTGKKGRVELVEQRVLEDSAARTISLWRERVAASSAGGSRCGDPPGDGSGEREQQREMEMEGGEGRSEVGSLPAGGHRHRHRRVPSGSVGGDPRLRRVASESPRYAGSGSVQGGMSRSGSVMGGEGGRKGKASYERSEYMVSYLNTKDGMPKELFSPRTEARTVDLPLAREVRTPSSPRTNLTYADHAPPSPTLRRHAARKSLDRSEYLFSYPQTPPLTGSQASSGSPTRTGKHREAAHRHSPPLRSPLQGSVGASDVLKATTTSSVEAILASCDPSLLHIAPVLHELGIRRVDHLRAVARLSEETRDREVKEQALRRGVSVVEWAIFLDKLQSL